jgi:SAM-dependent methyltransferase
VIEQVEGLVKPAARRLLPISLRRWLRTKRQGYEDNPPVGGVRFGSLRRVTPISQRFGFDRGQPIDRYYIESFLAQHANDVRGRVLEIGDDSYTRRFGDDRVTIRDVLHVAEDNPHATIVGDLTCADHIPSDAFDCVILTQTLHLIYDLHAALNTLYRILKPGGVLLVTFPGISQIDHYDWGVTWYWGFTTRSAQRLFVETFPAENVAIEAHGNVLAAIAFLHGLAVEEMRPEELDYRDPDYEVLITVRAVKPNMNTVSLI